MILKLTFRGTNGSVQRVDYVRVDRSQNFMRLMPVRMRRVVIRRG